METVVWAVGTTNKAKLECVARAVERCLAGKRHSVVAAKFDSAVGAQPMSAEETQRGAEHRARQSLETVPEADFGVGLEGGVEKVGGRWFECGWMCVIERRTGRIGWGSSARFEMSSKIMSKIVNEKKELADVIDELSGMTDVRSTLGAMGVLTAGHLARAEAYSHGLIFALAPFLSDPATYWDS